MARAFRVRWLLSEAQPAVCHPVGTPEGAGTDGADADGAAVELEGAAGAVAMGGTGIRTWEV